MPEDVRELFAEYADAYARGDRPRARDYLVRAGADAHLLATMIERFLGTVRTPSATQRERERVAELLETPLLELRKRRRMRVDDVVDALAKALAIGSERRKKLRLYYQQLENGTLDPAGVSDRVWAVLEGVLGAGKLVPAAAPRRLRLDAEVAYYRVDASAAPPAAPADIGGAARAPADERDEVDELFLGAPKP